MAEPLRTFGIDHLAGLALVLGGAVAAFRIARARRFDRPLRFGLVVLLPAALTSLMLLDAGAGMSWRSYAPLQICDLAVPLAVWALLSQRPCAFELTFLWSGAGTVSALLTPDVPEGFPHWRFLLYIAQHGGLVVASAFLLGSGLRPRAGASWRALGWLNLAAVLVGVVDAWSGANFMYLRARPARATPLDWFGPWPWYIGACELVAFGLFAALVAAARRLEAPPLQDVRTGGGGASPRPPRRRTQP